MSKIILLILGMIIILSCDGMFNHLEREKCVENSDCQEWEFCTSNKECEEDICKGKYHEIPNCGKGICKPDMSSYHCECDKEAVLIEKISNGYICSPTCNAYSEECTEFGKTTDFNRCNISKGHCDTKCQGDGSCQDGYVCDGGVCERYID